jgi:hypothetical protein
MASPVTVVRRSENKKLSTDKNVNATYASQVTCPNSCPFHNSGCYAECGPIAYTTKRLNASKEIRPTMVARHEAKQIRQLDAQFPLRLHVVGDCKNKKSAEILAEACKEYSSKFNQKVWGYTHNRTIPREAWGNISILRSCTSLRQAEGALKANFGAALIVDKFKSNKRYAIGRNVFGIPCPVQTGLAKSCVDCKLCLNEEGLKKTNSVILLEAHGTGKNAIIRAISKD